MNEYWKTFDWRRLVTLLAIVVILVVIL